MVMVVSGGEPALRPRSRRRRRTRTGASRMARACERSSRERIMTGEEARGRRSAAARAVPKPRLHRGDLRRRHRCTGRISPVRSRCSLPRFDRSSRRPRACLVLLAMRPENTLDDAEQAIAVAAWIETGVEFDRARHAVDAHGVAGVARLLRVARREAPRRQRDVQRPVEAATGHAFREADLDACASARRQRGRGSGVSSGSPASPNARSRDCPGALPFHRVTTIRKRRPPRPAAVPRCPARSSSRYGRREVCREEMRRDPPDRGSRANTPA